MPQEPILPGRSFRLRARLVAAGFCLLIKKEQEVKISRPTRPPTWKRFIFIVISLFFKITSARFAAL